MRISRAGFFRELPHGRGGGESLLEAADSGGTREAELLEYLWGNTVLAATASMVDDAIDPSATAVSPLEFVTDGVWVWPRDLAYYVEKYHVAVPAAFLAHIKDRGGVQPSLTPLELLRVETEFLKG